MKLKGFYLPRDSNYECYTHYPIRVEFNEDKRYYNMISEDGSFCIHRRELNGKYKLCPKKYIKHRIDALREKIKIYE